MIYNFLIAAHLSFISSNKQKVWNIHAKLPVKACYVLTCLAFICTLSFFINKVKKPVIKYDKMDCLEPVYKN